MSVPRRNRLPHPTPALVHSWSRPAVSAFEAVSVIGRSSLGAWISEDGTAIGRVAYHADPEAQARLEAADRELQAALDRYTETVDAIRAELELVELPGG